MDERGLGKQLQKARQRAGLTQQQLCHKANLSFSTLTKIERGAIKSPSIFTIQAIAHALDVSLDELTGDVSGMSRTKQYKTTKSGVKFVYFDVNGCLVYFYQRAFDRLAMHTGAHIDAVESAFWHYNDQVCRGEISMSDFNAKLAERLGIDSVNWQEYYLQSVDPIQEMQEVVSWAASLYRVGLMTNIMPGLLTSMRRGGQLPDVDIAQQTINLRQKYTIKTPDAIIAATALVNNSELWTANISDFSKIQGLKLRYPLK